LKSFFDFISKNLKKVSLGLFGTIVLCFLMPFVSIQCAGNTIYTFSGYDLIIGKTIEGDRQIGNIYVTLALISAIAGFAFTFLRYRLRSILTFACGLLGATFLLTFQVEAKVNLSKSVNKEDLSSMISVVFRYGYWITLLLFIVVSIITGYFAFGRKD